MFFEWYTYAPSGAAAGAAGQPGFTSSAAYVVGCRTIPLSPFETTGGVFNTATLASQTTNPAGTATVRFTSTAASKVGQAGIINLTRVGPTPLGCVAEAADPAPMMPGYGGDYGP